MIVEQLGEVSNSCNSYNTIDCISCIPYNLIACRFGEFTNILIYLLYWYVLDFHDFEQVNVLPSKDQALHN